SAWHGPTSLSQLPSAEPSRAVPSRRNGVTVPLVNLTVLMYTSSWDSYFAPKEGAMTHDPHTAAPSGGPGEGGNRPGTASVRRFAAPEPHRKARERTGI